MEFGGREKQRFLELLQAEWEKGAGAVDVSVVVRAMQAENLNAPEAEIGEMIRGIELAEAASALAEDEAEKDRGNAVIWKLDKQQLDECCQDQAHNSLILP